MLERSEPLHRRGIGETICPDEPIAPRLPRRPLDRFQAILSSLTIGFEHPTRAIPTAHILKEDGVAAPDSGMDERRPSDRIGSAVWRPVDQRRGLSRFDRTIEIGPEHDPVPHGDREAGVDPNRALPGETGYRNRRDACTEEERSHPTSTATSSRIRSRLSRLMATTCCQVPSARLPSITGMERLVLRIALLT